MPHSRGPTTWNPLRFRGLFTRFFLVYFDHFVNQLFKACCGRPAEFLVGVAGISEQGFHFSWSEISGVECELQRHRCRCGVRFPEGTSFPANPPPMKCAGGEFNEVAYRFLAPCGDHKSLREFPAAASAIASPRNRGHGPNLAGHRDCPCKDIRRVPASIRARPRVILRVTKVSPRRGDS